MKQKKSDHEEGQDMSEDSFLLIANNKNHLSINGNNTPSKLQKKILGYTEKLEYITKKRKGRKKEKEW